ncbi:MAG: CotH kinase family protein [Bacteroidota bacterium]
MLRIVHCLFIFIFSLSHLRAQINLESSSLPIVMIHTLGDTIVDDPRILAHMGIIHKQDGSQNHISDPFNVYDGQISIEIRGSSSQFFPKKSYGLETQLEDGSNNNVSLLGMPEENDWILHGPYSDKSLMRNRLAFELGAKLSVYAPRTRYCELLINGDYQGIYLLMEKIKRDDNRVDISRLDLGDFDSESITGGYIIKLDKHTGSGGGSGWRTPNGSFIQYDYPAASRINLAQKTYIQNYVEDFEQALFGYNFQDVEEGYRAHIDPLSFADFILINELTKNVDGYRLSTFFHKERNEKLKAGPIWDFNLGFGNANYCAGDSPHEWALNFNRHCPEDYWTINSWWDRLLSDPFFGELVIHRWRSLRQGLWHTDSIDALIDRQLVILDDTHIRNFHQWPVLGEWVWPNVVVLGSHTAEVDYLRTWIHDRLAWMDNNIEFIGFGVRGPFSLARTFIAPNPFSESLDLNVSSEFVGTVGFHVFDLMGRPLHSIFFDSEPGYEVRHIWDGKNSKGNPIPAGLYLFQFRINGDIVDEGKLVRQ